MYSLGKHLLKDTPFPTPNIEKSLYRLRYNHLYPILTLNFSVWPSVLSHAASKERISLAKYLFINQFFTAFQVQF